LRPARRHHEALPPSDACGAHDSPKLRVDDRRDISGIVHPLKSSGRWIDAPDIYSPGKTLYNRFVLLGG